MPELDATLNVAQQPQPHTRKCADGHTVRSRHHYGVLLTTNQVSRVEEATSPHSLSCFKFEVIGGTGKCGVCDNCPYVFRTPYSVFRTECAVPTLYALEDLYGTEYRLTVVRIIPLSTGGVVPVPVWEAPCPPMSQPHPGVVVVLRSTTVVR